MIFSLLRMCNPGQIDWVEQNSPPILDNHLGAINSRIYTAGKNNVLKLNLHLESFLDRPDRPPHQQWVLQASTPVLGGV